MPWIISEESALDGHENMARDRALLRRAEESGVAAARLYEWDGPWVSLGRFQRPERDLLDPDLIPWTLRPTGGKAVLHGHDLTIALACPLEALGCSRHAVRAAYRAIVRPLIAGLRSLGVDAVLAEETGSVSSLHRTADCFLHISPNDVVERQSGRKLIGCALRVTRAAVLAQCSVPVSEPLVDPGRVYEHPHTPKPLPVRAGALRSAIREALRRTEGLGPDVPLLAGDSRRDGS
ncbi:MAG: hypothetical protein IH851_11575 [Armatimonadetes bacterium]|nr:hypothetical protein [Armatimonadota bacterium]